MATIALPEKLQTIGDLDDLTLEGEHARNERPSGGVIRTNWIFDLINVELIWDFNTRTVSYAGDAPAGRVTAFQTALANFTKQTERREKWRAEVQRVKAAITPLIGRGVTEPTWTPVDDRRLLYAVAFAIGALDPDGKVRNPRKWLRFRELL